MGYLHIANLYKEQDILMFKECYALEKIHGCFNSKTEIKMANNKFKGITKIKKGEFVLGFKDGKIIPSKVLATNNNGKAQSWVYISGTRHGAGRGGSKFKIICTPNHRIYQPLSNNYKEAQNLAKGDKIALVRADYDISYIQQQIILGKILGDGSLCLKNNTGFIEFRHKQPHKEYVFYTLNSLGELANTRTNSNLISGYGTKMIKGSTYRNYYIFKYFKNFIKNGRKTISKTITNYLGPIALAFWYMDDGSLTHNEGNQEDSIMLATCSFNLEEHLILVKALKKFGINATIRQTGKYYRLAINSENSVGFFSLIAPYIPKCMQYKLPTAFRGFKENLPLIQSKLKHNLTMQTVLKIQSIGNDKVHSNKYDLTTETGNYFANDVLVHNSSAHLSFKKIEIGYFSGGEKYENFLKVFNEEELRKNYATLGIEEFIVYGEAYGGKCQGMSKVYGDKLRFVAFDVKIGNCWLSVPQANEIVVKLGLDFVDYKRIPTTLETIDAERDAISGQAVECGMGAGHKREGIVLRPLIEVIKNNGERIIAKHKREDYQETKSKREVTDPSKLKVLEEATAIAEEWVTPNRLGNILSKIENPSIKMMPDIIKTMIEDVKREGIREITWSKAVNGAISKKTANLVKEFFQNKLKENFGVQK